MGHATPASAVPRPAMPGFLTRFFGQRTNRGPVASTAEDRPTLADALDPLTRPAFDTHNIHPPARPPQQCATCRFWAPIAVGNDPRGNCRRRAPLVVMGKSGGAATRWAVTGPDDFCGDWRMGEEGRSQQAEGGRDRS